MANPPIYEVRHRTTCVPGAPTETTVVMLVSCMDDPAVTAVTVTCNGVDYVSGVDFTLAAFGYAWTGQLTITGLSAFTQYSWSVAQGSESDSGQLLTSPSASDDFSIFFESCDNNSQTSNNLGANPETVTGMYAHIKEYATSGGLPVVGAVFIDDYGYVDALGFLDDYLDASGLQGANPASGDENGVSIAWLSMIGSTGASAAPTYGDFDFTSNADLKAHFAREENRAWCRKNINLFPAWGDHEFSSDDIGYKTNVQAGSNARWTTYQVTDGLGASAWKAFLGNCQPPSIGTLDAHANHWMLTLGCLSIAAIDQVTNGDGSWSSNDEAPTQMTTVYGNNQIDDVLDELTSSDSAFKILAMPSGLRYLQQGAASGFSHLAQYPLFNHCVAEYKRLFTDSTDSLMRNANTNGTAGNLVTVGGDLHRACVTLNHSDEDAGIQGESYEHWQTGTINGSYNFDNNTGLVSGDEFVGTDGKTKSKLLYDEPVVDGKRFHVLRCDVYGSENPKRMVMTLIDRDGIEAYSRQYIHSQGNESKEVGAAHQASGISGDNK